MSLLDEERQHEATAARLKLPVKKAIPHTATNWQRRFKWSRA